MFAYWVLDSMRFCFYEHVMTSWDVYAIVSCVGYLMSSCIWDGLDDK